MLILALDSALGPCSAALWRDGVVLAAASNDSADLDADAALLPMVADVMAKAGVTYDSLDGIAVTIGPGSFTGLRVGVAAARGLSLAAAVPAVGITTLEALAAALDPAEIQGRKVLIAIAAGRGDVYAQVFGSDLRPLTEPACLPPVEALALENGALIATGDASDLLRAATGEGAEILPSRPISTAVVAARAATRLSALGVLAPPPEPLYLRRPAIRQVSGGP